jgi:iron complex transport system ATP-binding protein
MSSIALVNAGFKYGRQVILHDINLQTSAGEFLGVIGPNGCGKSTLLKCMCGLLRPYRGRVVLNGLDLAENNHGYTARNIALVPQNVALPPLFTVMDIVLMGRTPHLKLLQYEGKLDISIAIDAMEATQTLQLADKRVNELSGGEKQRVLIARALAQQAGILLLDEPTANLDINFQAEILNFVRQLCRDKGLSVVSALHDLNLASQYCDRIIMLKDGKICRQGNPWEALDTAAIRDIYGVDVSVYPHPVNSLPTALVTPRDTAGSN